MPGFRYELNRWEAEIAASFGENIAKFNETAAFADHIEQIAVLTRCRVGLMCS